MFEEWEEFHLTPGGWIRGSVKIDGKDPTRTPPPRDRVLTLRFIEQQLDDASEPTRFIRAIYAGPDGQQIRKLNKLHGMTPPGFAGFTMTASTAATDQERESAE